MGDRLDLSGVLIGGIAEGVPPNLGDTVIMEYQTICVHDHGIDPPPFQDEDERKAVMA
jgi:hypothetical protein